jgi:hypothetical protein
MYASCNNSGTLASVCLIISKPYSLWKKDIGYKMCTADPQYEVGVGKQLQYQSYKLSVLYVILTFIQALRDFWPPVWAGKRGVN